MRNPYLGKRGFEHQQALSLVYRSAAMQQKQQLWLKAFGPLLHRSKVQTGPISAQNTLSLE
jgi:hypothetical protein